MSGIFKGVKKVFKSVKKVVSKAVSTVKDVAQSVWESQIGRMAIMAAAVWFTAGTATAFSAAPQAGLGSAMAQSGANMWTTATSFMGAGPAAVASPAGSVAANAATAGTAVPLSASAGAPLAGAMAGPSAVTSTLAQQSVPAAAGSPGILGRVMGTIQKNPLATMMVGMGVSNAVASSNEKDAQSNRQEWLDNTRRERGLMGSDYGGKGSDLPTQSGILAPYVSAPPGPTVSAPNAPGSQPQTAAVNSKDLLSLQKQGLIANPVRRA